MAKTVNYTPEQVNVLVSAYEVAGSDEARAEVVETFANDLGKSVASIRAKLSREGVYVKKAVASTNKPKVKKDAKVAQLATLLGKDEDLVSDAEKLTHRTLDFIINALS